MPAKVIPFCRCSGEIVIEKSADQAGNADVPHDEEIEDSLVTLSG
jgi:hypothetical protein